MWISLSFVAQEGEKIGTVDVGRRDVSAIERNIAVTQVVGEEDQYIRFVWRGSSARTVTCIRIIDTRTLVKDLISLFLFQELTTTELATPRSTLSINRGFPVVRQTSLGTNAVGVLRDGMIFRFLRLALEDLRPVQAWGIEHDILIHAVHCPRPNDRCSASE